MNTKTWSPRQLMSTKFWKDDTGSATIEFVMWLPILVAILAFVTDTSILIQNHQDTYNIARDASRSVALGQRTTEQAVATLTEKLGEEANARVVIENNYVISSAEVPTTGFSSLQAALSGEPLAVNVAMFVENSEGS